MSRYVSVKQIELLTDFMEQHRDVAVGRPRCKEDRAVLSRLWAKVAGMLNAIGVVKSPKDWSRFFHEYKHRIKIKALKIARNDPHNYTMTLGPLQQRLCTLIWPFLGLNDVNGHNLPELPMADNTNSVSTSMFETVAEICNLKEETFPVSSDDEDFSEIDIQNRKISKIKNCDPTENPINETEGPSRDTDFDSSWDKLADLEKAKLEINREKLKTLVERNAIERQNIEALKDLAGATWALVNILKGATEVGNNRKRRAPSENENET